MRSSWASASSVHWAFVPRLSALRHEKKISTDVAGTLKSPPDHLDGFRPEHPFSKHFCLGTQISNEAIFIRRGEVQGFCKLVLVEQQDVARTQSAQFCGSHATIQANVEDELLQRRCVAVQRSKFLGAIGVILDHREPSSKLTAALRYQLIALT